MTKFQIRNIHSSVFVGTTRHTTNTPGTLMPANDDDDNDEWHGIDYYDDDDDDGNDFEEDDDDDIGVGDVERPIFEFIILAIAIFVSASVACFSF